MLARLTTGEKANEPCGSAFFSWLISFACRLQVDSLLLGTAACLRCKALNTN